MRPGRIAVVDDDPAMVDTLSDILELHGWDPVRARDGRAAVELVAKRHVDAVLMDIRMPVMNGVDALQAMRATEPDIPVVLFTASAAQDLLKRAAAHGAHAVLTKPVDVPALLALLEGLPQAG